MTIDLVVKYGCILRSVVTFCSPPPLDILNYDYLGKILRKRFFNAFCTSWGQKKKKDTWNASVVFDAQRRSKYGMLIIS